MITATFLISGCVVYDCLHLDRLDTRLREGYVDLTDEPPLIAQTGNRDTGEILLPPLGNCSNPSKQLEIVRNVELLPHDVIVVGYPKSGNNWTHHMVSLLKAGTTELPFLFGKDEYTYLEGIGGDMHLPTLDNPRVLLSHLPFRLLPRDMLKKKVKVVYMTRNPKDVMVSMYCFLKNLNPLKGYGGTWTQFFSYFLEEGHWFGHVFDHLMDWQREIEVHPDHPIFHCNYEESKKDTLAQVEKLNKFLGTGRSRELCKAIADASQIDNMRRTRRVDEATLRGNFMWKEGVDYDAFFRKGTVGDWKNWFTVAQNEQFDDVYAAKMADYKRSFVFE